MDKLDPNAIGELLAAVGDHLESGEVDWVEYGGLEVGFAGRQSLIALKLFAAVDRGPESVHVQDLLAPKPSHDELSNAADWVATQDASEPFERMLREVVEHVRRSS